MGSDNEYGYIIEWFDGCWFSKGSGDPCRTMVIDNAQVFKSISSAKSRITIDSKKNPHRCFDKCKIQLVVINCGVIKVSN